MAPAGRPKKARGQKSGKPISYLASKFMRLLGLRQMLLFQQRKSTKEQARKLDLIKETGEGRTQMNLEIGANTSSWRDPDATFCCICGDEEENHVEQMCPYNYLSPASYAPCRTRHIFWGNETTAFPWKSRRTEEAPRHDEITLRRLKFLRCFVRVNNLPRQCCPEKVASLFNQFGPLLNWYLASHDHDSGACRGFGYMVFQHRQHAEEAINALNCYSLGDRKLRVDWAYPCA